MPGPGTGEPAEDQARARRYFIAATIIATATLTTFLGWSSWKPQVNTHYTSSLRADPLWLNDPLEMNAVKFSRRWLSEFATEDLGCNGTDPYVWREAGYGSNMNFLLLAWANAIIEGRNDVSVVVNTQDYFSRTTCDVASKGVETGGGWSCFFAPMPHVCAFDSREDLFQYNIGRGVPDAEQETIQGRGNVPYIRKNLRYIQDSIDGSGVDLMEALANLYEYLLLHLQPWCKADIRAILEEPDIATIRQGNYVGMHVRRTDKAKEVAFFPEIKTYFENVVNYLNSPTSALAATDITGLWLSTDDDTVVKEVKEMVSNYFPNTSPEAVLFITGRVPVRDMSQPGVVLEEGDTDRNTYEARVLLLAEMDMLAGSDVFAGTLSSNLGRVVALMRLTLGKPKESLLTCDFPSWIPGRFRRLRPMYR